MLPILLPMLTWAKAHWRKLFFVALMLGAFLFGRFSRKPQVQTVTQVQYKDRIVTQVVERKAEAKTETKTVVVYRDRIVHKDGTSETKTETKIVQGDQEQTTDDRTTAKTKTDEGSKTATVTPVAKKWNVDVGIGAPVSLRRPFFSSPFLLVDVSRQVVGPFSLGVWSTFDLNGKNPALGLSVGVSF